MVKTRAYKTAPGHTKALYNDIQSLGAILCKYYVFGSIRTEKFGNHFTGFVYRFGGEIGHFVTASARICTVPNRCAAHCFYNLGRFGISGGGIIKIYHFSHCVSSISMPESLSTPMTDSVAFGTTRE